MLRQMSWLTMGQGHSSTGQTQRVLWVRPKGMANCRHILGPPFVDFDAQRKQTGKLLVVVNTNLVITVENIELHTLPSVSQNKVDFQLSQSLIITLSRNSLMNCSALLKMSFRSSLKLCLRASNRSLFFIAHSSLLFLFLRTVSGMYVRGFGSSSAIMV